MDKKMRKVQDKLLRELETSQDIEMLTPTARAAILPVVYRMFGKVYKKGVKRGKNEVVELINNIKI